MFKLLKSRGGCIHKAILLINYETSILYNLWKSWYCIISVFLGTKLMPPNEMVVTTSRFLIYVDYFTLQWE